ncbi:MAG: hypothetical protein Q9191_007353 [Dirinaria sp. TL-2023a]
MPNIAFLNNVGDTRLQLPRAIDDLSTTCGVKVVRSCSPITYVEGMWRQAAKRDKTSLKVHVHPTRYLGPAGSRLESFGHCVCHDEHRPHNSSSQAMPLTLFLAKTLGCLRPRHPDISVHDEDDVFRFIFNELAQGFTGPARVFMEGQVGWQGSSGRQWEAD